MSGNSYDQLISQLNAKLNRQEGAIAATKLHIEAIKSLKTQEAAQQPKPKA